MENDCPVDKQDLEKEISKLQHLVYKLTFMLKEYQIEKIDIGANELLAEALEVTNQYALEMGRVDSVDDNTCN